MDSNLRLYRGNYKREFIDKYESKGTQRIWQWLFDKTFIQESKFSKELFDFNLEEFEEFFKSRRWNKKTTEYYIRLLILYCDWAIEKGIKRINRNYLAEEDINTLTERFSSINVEYLTDEEIKELIGYYDELRDEEEDNEILGMGIPSLYNYQDKLMIYLLFLGVNAGDALHELVNLKYEDVDFEKKALTLTNSRGEQRKLIVPDYCLYLIKTSQEEQMYTRYQDDEREYKNKREAHRLADTPYLMKRSLVGSSSKDDRINSTSLRARLYVIGDYIGSNINPKIIQMSGILATVKAMIDKGIEINRENMQRFVFSRYVGYDKYQGQLKLIRTVKKLIPEVYPEIEDL